MVRDGGRVLVGWRGADQHLGGHAEFPGGHREAGESLAECVVREVREETGLAVRVVRPLLDARHEDSTRRLALAFFECVPIDGSALDPAAVAARRLQWVALADLAALPFPPANRPLVRALIEQAQAAEEPR